MDRQSVPGEPQGTSSLLGTNYFILKDQTIAHRRIINLRIRKISVIAGDSRLDLF